MNIDERCGNFQETMKKKGLKKEETCDLTISVKRKVRLKVLELDATDKRECDLWRNERKKI